MINGPKIMSQDIATAESTMRQIFSEAMMKQPAIIFIDEIDAIAPNSEKAVTENQR